MKVVVHAANIQDQDGAKEVLRKAKRRFPRLKFLWADSAYARNYLPTWALLTCNLLLDIVRRCQTGEARLKGLMPAGAEVAHKTGTIGMSADDVGILTLPDNAGHVALAVFVKSSENNEKARERAIAEIGRAVFDYFLFNPN